jgi:hypothetical protein
VFIPEQDRDSVMNELIKVFREGAAPVKATEIDQAIQFFDWGKILDRFWHGVKNEYAQVHYK